MMRHISGYALALLLIFAGVATAQEEEFDPKKAIEQIKKDLDSAIEDLAELSGESIDAKKGERIADNLDKLLEGMQGSQSRIAENIDELVRKMKSKKGKSSSSSSSSQQKSKSNSQSGQSQGNSSGQSKPQSRGSRRDRNEAKQQGKKPGEKPGGKEKSRPTAKGDPKGGEKGDGKLENTRQGRKQPSSGREETPVMIDKEGWGHLPPEVRQLLVDKNFREYYPDYEREISDYLKSLNRRKR